ncbi:MAG: hypothetical protein M3439_12905 [Chloroflexota bacterium]|nr:hypothetical protein [Chloroflexota bacterium]
MLKRLLQPGHGHRVPIADNLALNLSFVLHDRSDSRAVQRAVSSSQAHARQLRRLGPELAVPTTTSGSASTDVTIWLSATIGLPHLLADALNTSPDRLIAVDTGTAGCDPCQFFRAAANLSLPDASTIRIGVAALILRPDRRSSHLALSSLYDWPEDRDAAIRELERLVQVHAGQWMPQRALWPSPAEALLSSEVY